MIKPARAAQFALFFSLSKYLTGERRYPIPWRECRSTCAKPRRSSA
jgi:hypothetical protein